MHDATERLVRQLDAAPGRRARAPNRSHVPPPICSDTLTGAVMLVGLAKRRFWRALRRAVRDEWRELWSTLTKPGERS
jgi:hypothetical protein